MPKTRLDIAQLALQHIGVVGVGDVASTEDEVFADEALTLAVAELVTDHGLTMPADLNATPDDLARPLARLVSVDIAPSYSAPAEPRSRAVARIRSILLPDDRPDAADYDEDGTVTEAELAASIRAQYY